MPIRERVSWMLNEIPWKIKPSWRAQLCFVVNKGFPRTRHCPRSLNLAPIPERWIVVVSVQHLHLLLAFGFAGVAQHQFSHVVLALSRVYSERGTPQLLLRVTIYRICISCRMKTFNDEIYCGLLWTRTLHLAFINFLKDATTILL